MPLTLPLLALLSMLRITQKVTANLYNSKQISGHFLFQSVLTPSFR